MAGSRDRNLTRAFQGGTQALSRLREGAAGRFAMVEDAKDRKIARDKAEAEARGAEVEAQLKEELIDKKPGETTDPNAPGAPPIDQGLIGPRNQTPVPGLGEGFKQPPLTEEQMRRKKRELDVQGGITDQQIKEQQLEDMLDPKTSALDQARINKLNAETKVLEEGSATDQKKFQAVQDAWNSTVPLMVSGLGPGFWNEAVKAGVDINDPAALHRAIYDLWDNHLSADPDGSIGMANPYQSLGEVGEFYGAPAVIDKLTRGTIGIMIPTIHQIEEKAGGAKIFWDTLRKIPGVKTPEDFKDFQSEGGPSGARDAIVEGVRRAGDSIEENLQNQPPGSNRRFDLSFMNPPAATPPPAPPTAAELVDQGDIDAAIEALINEENR